MLFYSYIEVVDGESETLVKKGIELFGDFSKEEKAYMAYANLFSEKAASFIPEGLEIKSADYFMGMLTIEVNECIQNYGGSYYEKRFIYQLMKTAESIGAKSLTVKANGKTVQLPEGSLIFRRKVLELELPEGVNQAAL